MSNNEHAQLHEGSPGVPSDVGDDSPVANELAALQGTRTLERLRERVEAAARELIRLRRDNAALARRLTELEAGAGADDESAMPRLDEDAETLRARIDVFVQAIDFYLAQDREAETGE